MQIIDDPSVTPDPEDTSEQDTEELAKASDILQNGKSVNAALMRLVNAYGGNIELSDTNAQLIDKLVAFAGGGNSLTVHVNVSEDDTNVYYTLDKTWQEIFDARQVNIIREVSPDKKTHWSITTVEKVSANAYDVLAEDVADDWRLYTFVCTTKNSYPTATFPK